MNNSNEKNKKTFCVVQFINQHFENIDVCVPHSWVISRKLRDRKSALVVYPKDEDPFKTRDRVRKLKNVGKIWKVYEAIIKYESDSYEAAEYWIATTRNGDAPIEEEKENSDTKDPQPEPVLVEKLRSAAQYPLLSSNRDQHQQAIKPYENTLAAKPYKNTPKPMSIKRPVKSKSQNRNSCNKSKLDKSAKSTCVIGSASMASEPSKRKQSIDKQSSPVRQDCEQNRSMPDLDVDESKKVISMDQEAQPERLLERRISTNQTRPPASEQPCQPEPKQERHNSIDRLEELLQDQYVQETSVKHPKGTNGSSQKTDLHCNATVVQITAPKPSTTANKISTERSTVNHENRRLRIASTSHHTPHLIQLGSLISNYQIPSLPNIENLVTKKNNSKNIMTNKTTASQNSLISTSQSISLPSHSAEGKTHLVTQSHQQEI